jgi:hypothetical protein
VHVGHTAIGGRIAPSRDLSRPVPAARHRASARRPSNVSGPWSALRMDRLLLSSVVLLVMLAVAPTATGQSVTDESDAFNESEGTCADAATNGRQLVRIDRTDPATTLDSSPAAATTATGADLVFGGRDARTGDRR